MRRGHGQGDALGQAGALHRGAVADLAQAVLEDGPHGGLGRRVEQVEQVIDASALRHDQLPGRQAADALRLDQELLGDERSRDGARLRLRLRVRDQVRHGSHLLFAGQAERPCGSIR